MDPAVAERPDSTTTFSRSVIIFTRVDGTLREQWEQPSDTVCAAVATVAGDGVPVILVSDEAAARVEQLQHDLAVTGPFICDGGESLFIPRGYFEELDGLSAGDDQWEVFSFPSGDLTRAVRLLTSLFAVHADDLLTVGLGCDWSDKSFLRAVDVPIVVRNDGRDQRRLLRSLPNAYLTTASGGHGWSEAVLGSSAL